MGFESYLNNLGIDPGAVLLWTTKYVDDNFQSIAPKERIKVAAMLSRALAIGLVLGRDKDHQP